MKKSLLAILVFIFGHLTLWGQTAPVFSHFYANPFQFNPAYAASNGYTEANIFYRKQWLNIDNAPTTLAFNIQAPVGRNVSLGLTAVSDQTILLNTNYVYGTFGYRIRFSPVHHLNFGISAGVGFNSFDFEAIGESNDPVLLGVSENNSFLTGQFGIYYRLKNFSVGLALPKLFDSRPNSLESFNEIEFNKFKNKFASISYTINLRDIQLTPIAIYRAINEQADQWEGMLMASYKNMLWFGASYRNEYGMTGFIGVNIKRLFRIGYAYEYPTGDIKDVSGGTHEIYLGGRIGKKNREEIIAQEEDKEVQDSGKTEVAAVEEAKETPSVEVVDSSSLGSASPKAANEPLTETPHVIEPEQPSVSQKVPTEPEPTVEEKITEPEEKVITDDNSNSELSGYYVVVGVFSKIENALRQMAKLKEDGKKPAILFRAEKGFYYVYTYSSKSREEAIEQLKILRRQNKYFAAWMYMIQE